jgi:hypothetical protein
MDRGHSFSGILACRAAGANVFALESIDRWF